MCMCTKSDQIVSRKEFEEMKIRLYDEIHTADISLFIERLIKSILLPVGGAIALHYGILPIYIAILVLVECAHKQYKTNKQKKAI